MKLAQTCTKPYAFRGCDPEKGELGLPTIPLMGVLADVTIEVGRPWLLVPSYSPTSVVFSRLRRLRRHRRNKGTPRKKGGHGTMPCHADSTRVSYFLPLGAGIAGRP
jgi:hypothetical protein